VKAVILNVIFTWTNNLQCRICVSSKALESQFCLTAALVWKSHKSNTINVDFSLIFPTNRSFDKFGDPDSECSTECWLRAENGPNDAILNVVFDLGNHLHIAHLNVVVILKKINPFRRSPCTSSTIPTTTTIGRRTQF
jgi:hypothetical protein